MTRREGELYGYAEGVPWEDQDPPEANAQSLVDDVKRSNQALKKRVRDIVDKSLKCSPGRHIGSGRRLPPEATDLWKEGLSRAGICHKFRVPCAEVKAFKNCLNTAIGRLSDAEKLAGKAAQQQARARLMMARRASSALRTKSL
jgi:hypothetical protein